MNSHHPLLTWHAQVKEYYGEYNTLERGKGAVMKESQKASHGDTHVPPTLAQRLIWTATCRLHCAAH